MAALRLVRRNPCAVLLAVQALGIVLYPFLDDWHAGRQAFALFGLLVLALALYAVQMTVVHTWVLVTIAIPATLLLVLQIFSDSNELMAWSSGFEAVLYFYAAFAMTRYMLEDDEVTTDELFAIGAVFTLMAWAFAHLFVVLQALDPGAFGAVGEPRTWNELLFVSFTTLSSTGLSDIMPVTGHARSAVMVEQVAGIFYVAMVVTRLINLSATRRRRR